MILSSKIVTALAWILIILQWIDPSRFEFLGSTFNSIIHWSGVFLIVAHAIETIIFLPKAKKVGGNLNIHVIQLLLFGYVYNMELENMLKAKNNEFNASS